MGHFEILKTKLFWKSRAFYSSICLMKFWYFFTETCLHLIMLKGDMEIHFLDRTVDHPITVGKLMPSTSPVWKTEAPRNEKDINALHFKLPREYLFCVGNRFTHY